MSTIISFSPLLKKNHFFLSSSGWSYNYEPMYLIWCHHTLGVLPKIPFKLAPIIGCSTFQNLHFIIFKPRSENGLYFGYIEKIARWRHKRILKHSILSFLIILVGFLNVIPSWLKNRTPNRQNLDPWTFSGTPVSETPKFLNCHH